MNVKLKTKKLQSGKISLYLSYYNPDTQNRKKESLGLYLIDKPKDVLEGDHNKQTKSLATKIHSKKLLEYQNSRFGFISKSKNNIGFLEYFDSIAEQKKESTSKTNYSNWRTTSVHINKFTRASLKLSENSVSYVKMYLYLKNGLE